MVYFRAIKIIFFYNKPLRNNPGNLLSLSENSMKFRSEKFNKTIIIISIFGNFEKYHEIWIESGVAKDFNPETNLEIQEYYINKSI